MGYLLSLYDRLIISDWNLIRLEQNRNAFPNADVKLIHFTPGKPPAIPEGVDLVLCMWSQRYLGDPAVWMKEFIDTLTPRGRLKVVEKVARKMDAEQQLTDTVLNLRLKLDAACGANVHPGCEHDQFLIHAKSNSLNHIRAPKYTDQDLLMNTAEWHYEAKILIRGANQPLQDDQNRLTPEFVRQCISIFGNNPEGLWVSS